MAVAGHGLCQSHGEMNATPRCHPIGDALKTH